jgi:hypothetical protein
MSGVQFGQQIDMNGFKITEVGAGVASTDAVNVSQLASLAPQGFAADIGNGVATTITVSHGLSTFDVMVQVYKNSTFETVMVDVIRSAEDDVQITFGTAPTTNEYRVLVIPVPA